MFRKQDKLEITKVRIAAAAAEAEEMTSSLEISS